MSPRPKKVLILGSSALKIGEAVDYNVPLITNRQTAMRLAEALSRLDTEDLQIKSRREYQGVSHR